MNLAVRGAQNLSGAVLTEVIRNGLVAITEEMKTNLVRTAYSPIIYEALDFTVGVFDEDGNTISIGIGLPSFIRGMSETVKAKIARFGKENIHPGDVILTNDAYVTGSHLNHMTFTTPVFAGGGLIGFTCCMGHWMDVGGALPGLTTDIYSEGLQMPIVKVWERGVLREEFIDIICMNVRQPERAMGDIRAQIAAIKSGERRFAEMAAKYGKEAVLGSIARIMDQSEAAVRERVRAMPDGVYEAESFMDDDGVETGKRIPIKVKVAVAGDEMTVDLSEVGAQVRGFYNSGESAGRGAAQMALKCLTSASELPFNDGCFRPLKIVLPPGKVVSASRPAAMRAWMTYPMTIVDTIIKALADALPDQVAAGHHADLCATMVSGIHPRDKKFFIAPGLIGGGWGAKHNEDGVSATVSMNDGDTHNVPTEQFESEFPLLVESYRLRPDSGGAGRYRGGLGTEQTVRVLTDVSVQAQIDRCHCPPWGLFGGGAAAPNGFSLYGPEGEEMPLPNGKVLGRRLKAGERYTRRSGGGGGFGSPLDRPLAEVARDVREGYVSLEAARKSYGVVIDPETFEIDEAASLQCRREMRAARGAP